MRGAWPWTALALVATMSFAVAIRGSPAAGHEVFIDFAHGSDDAAGTAAAPWQHAPGDPAAAGRAAARVLGPGDVIRFRGGVPYRGTVLVRTSGAPGRPITFTGDGFGVGNGVIDGADPAAAVGPCPSAAACGGVPNWQDLSLVRFEPPQTDGLPLYDETGPLAEAQWPVPRDPFYADEVGQWLTTPRADAARIEAGRLRAPEAARATGAGTAGALLFWVRGNEAIRRPITRVEGDDLLFDPAGLDLYDDRDGRVAVVGGLRRPLAPRSFAVIGPGQAVANLGSARVVFVGSGRRGFLIQGAAHIVIRDFAFRRQTGSRRRNDQGIAIEARRAPAGDLLIARNTFGPAVMANQQGAIRLSDVEGAVVGANRFEGLVQGSGIRTGANNLDVRVTGNVFHRIGRTAIAFFGVSRGVIDGNVIDDVRGLHGNGISLYLSNRGVTVSNNRITDATRPMTFHGDKVAARAPGDHDLVIERNIMISTDIGQAALTSWGLGVRGVTIRQNYLAGAKTGLLLDGGDQRVSVSGNVMTGIVENKPASHPDWSVERNRMVGRGRAAGTDPRGLCGALSLPAGTGFGGGTC